MADSANTTFDTRYIAREESMTGPMLVYAAYLLSIPSAGLFALVGVILAYVMKSDAGPQAFSHYAFQIRTFWLSLVAIPLGILLMIVGVPLSFLLIGIPFVILGALMAFGVTIWFLVRCVVGLIRAVDGRGYANYRTWMI